jgi:hypothetical protein
MGRMAAPPVLRSLACAAALALAVTLTGCSGDEPEPEAAPTETTSSPSSQDPSASSGPEDPAGPSLQVTVDGSEVSPLGETLELSVGDTLTVTVSSDRAGELHVHSSPEQYVEFEAGETRHPVTLDKPGQVDIEEHESGALVARLLVE